MSGNTILAAVSDLIFQSRLREQAAALGYGIAVADAPETLRDGLDRAPALLVVDLHAGGLDWRRAVEAAKRRGVPVLAFGRHTEARLLRAAREAGCDRVVPRSTLVAELPQLLRQLAAPRPASSPWAGRRVRPHSPPPSRGTSMPWTSSPLIIGKPPSVIR